MDRRGRRSLECARRIFILRRGHHGRLSRSHADAERAGFLQECPIMSGPVPAALPREEIERRVRELGEWFQNIDLHGVHTAPGHFLGDYPACKWRAFAHAVPSDLTGRTVLDIGCNARFYSLEMKRR